MDELRFEKEERLSTVRTTNASAIVVTGGPNCELKYPKKLLIMITVVQGQMQL